MTLPWLLMQQLVELPPFFRLERGIQPTIISKGEDWGAFSWIVDLDPKSHTSKTPLLTMLSDVQDQLPGQLCELLLGDQYRCVNLALSKSVALDDVSEILLLIQETELYIQNHQVEWRALCKWVAENFT